MTLRVWGRALLTAACAGALVAAGQLGVAYGLGVVRLVRTFDVTAGNQWNAQLAWVSWFAILAAVAGAAAAERVVRRHQATIGTGARILLALFGGVGASAAIPLTVRPARAAQLAQSVDPALVMGLAAGLGAVAGVLIAVAALSLRPLAWNLAAVSTVTWLAGIVAVVRYLGPNDPAHTARLGVPQWAVTAGNTNQLVDTLAMPVLAWLAGAVVAAVARARRESSLNIATSGMAGAAPLALAYLIAGPGANSDLSDQMSPYLGALFAVPSGLLGSLLVALIPHGDQDGERDPAVAAGASSDPPAQPTETPEPTDTTAPVVSPSPTASTEATPAAPTPKTSTPKTSRPAASIPKARTSDEHIDWVSALSAPDEPAKSRHRKAGKQPPSGQDGGR